MRYVRYDIVLYCTTDAAVPMKVYSSGFRSVRLWLLVDLRTLDLTRSRSRSTLLLIRPNQRIPRVRARKETECW